MAINDYRYPYDFENSEDTDLEAIRRVKKILRTCIVDKFNDRANQIEKAREYIGSLSFRESIKLALECWSEEYIARSVA